MVVIWSNLRKKLLKDMIEVMRGASRIKDKLLVFLDLEQYGGHGNLWA